MASVDADAVLQQFDDLKAAGELFYEPSTWELLTCEHNLKLSIRTTPSFNSKPQLPTHIQNGTSPTAPAVAESPRRPPPRDGSDIDHADPAFHVADLGETHKLILNKFCVFRPQFLLLTQDPLRRQAEALDGDDLAVAWRVMQELSSTKSRERYYVLFNCGRDGGSSRVHKHMQVLREPDGQEEMDLDVNVRDILCLLDKQGDASSIEHDARVAPDKFALPFSFALQSLALVTIDGALELVKAAYARQLAFCAAQLGLAEDERCVPHNLVLTHEWMIMLPRRRPTLDHGALGGHVVNSTGMLGLVWAGNAEQVEAWKREDPRTVLARLGVSAL